MNKQTQENNKLSFEEYFNYITKDWLRAGFTERQLFLVKLLCETFEARGRREENNKKTIEK